mgnify:CR=1 FL=1
MEKPESFFDEDVLRKLTGPNSFIFTVLICPKWDKIVNTFLKKVEGWPGLPEKLLYSYQHQFHKDMVSGLKYGRSDFLYLHLNKDQDIDAQLKKTSGILGTYGFATSENSYPTDIAAFNCPTSNTKFELESPNYWCNYIFGNHEGCFFRVTLGGEHELGALDIRQIFHSLKKMDDVLVGASMKRPLCEEALADENTLVYTEIDNPARGFHVFENDYVSVSIQRQSFRGVFTRIDDYDEEQDELLDVKYYGKKEITQNVKKNRDKLDKIYFERSEIPVVFFANLRKEEGRSIKASLDSWPDKYKQLMKDLDELIQDIKKCGLDNRTISEYFFLEWFLLELYEWIDIYTRYHNNEDQVGNFRIKAASLFTDTSGSGEQVSLGNDSFQFLIKKYEQDKLPKSFHRRQKIAILKADGSEIFSFNIYVNGGDVRGKQDYEPLKHLGEITSCSDGDWPFFLLRSRFDLEAQIAVRAMEASLKGNPMNR